MRPHLRTVMGLASALMVAAVAAVTIVVATTLAFSTINANGRRAVSTQCNAGVASANLIFTLPAAALRSISRLPDTFGGSPFPTETIESITTTAEEPDGPIVDRYLELMLHHQLESGFKWMYMAAILYDGSGAVSTYAPRITPLGVKATTVPRADGTRVLNVRLMNGTDGTPQSTSSVVGGMVASVARSSVKIPDLRVARLRQYYDTLVANTTPAKVYWSSPSLVVTNGVFTRPIIAFHRVRHLGVPVGVAYTTLEPIELGDMLGAARGTEGSHAFAVDQDGFVVASTATDAPHLHNFNISRDHVPGAGCMTTLSNNDDMPTTGIPDEGMTCLDHMSVAKVMGGELAAVAAAFPTIVSEALDASDGAPIVRDDAHRFAAAQRLPALAANDRPIFDIPGKSDSIMRIVVVVITPRAEVLGTASQIIPRSAIITVCIVIIVAGGAFALVWAVLRPLQPIAQRMGKAARLEDDDPPASRSWLAEVYDLQAAFDEMATELNRVRSFVPQSLLHAADEDDEDADDDADMASEGAFVPAGHASFRSVGSAASVPALSRIPSTLKQPSRQSVQTSNHETRSTVSHMKCAAFHSRTTEGVVMAQITVLCINLRAFHASLVSKDSQGMSLQATSLDQDALGRTVQAVLAAATAQKGVVDSFHGDRFMVTFNASRPAAGHAARAARTAAALAETLASAGLQLTPSQGVATGPALVGNVGCNGLKRFAAMGTVVSRAAALERLCKLYAGVTCLVPQRLFADLSTAVRLLTVDVVRLPGVAAACAIAAVQEQVDSCETGAQDEWMYQLEAGEQSSTGTTPTASVNNAWALLSSRQYEMAAQTADVLDREYLQSEKGHSLVFTASVTKFVALMKVCASSLPAAQPPETDLGTFFSVAVAS